MVENMTNEVGIGVNQATEGLSDAAREQLIGLCAKRTSSYALLARLFRVEIDEETYANLKKAAFPAKTGNAKVDSGYRSMATYLSNDHDDALLELAVDYARIFIGHGNTAYSAAYPFESVYTSEKRLLMQEARDEILHDYAQAGLVIMPGWKEPEDHIALELEYMQIMSRRAAEALQESDNEGALALLGDQRVFLTAHLTSWILMLTSDMRRFAKTDFYQGLSYLTEGFLSQDKEFLASVVQEQDQ